MSSETGDGSALNLPFDTDMDIARQLNHSLPLFLQDGLLEDFSSQMHFYVDIREAIKAPTSRWSKMSTKI